MNPTSSFPQSNKDPIWGTPVIEMRPTEDQWTKEYNSPRCGGWYSIHKLVANQVNNLNDRQKAILTSWLIEQRRSGTECPRITKDVIQLAKQRDNMFALDRADAILKFIGSKTCKLGENVIYASRDPNQEIEEFRDEQMSSFFTSDTSRRANYYELIAFSESIDYHELNFLLDYLKERKWVKISYVEDEYTDTRTKQLYYDEKSELLTRSDTKTESCLLTPEGYARLAEIQETKTDSSRGFMAMWFDQSMDKVWEKGFKPGIEKAGYQPMRISDKHHNNNIVDEIIAEIRRSRFVVADLTHNTDKDTDEDKKGVRGSVYYEAGFAHGHNIPVIFTCREDCKIHFDIRQYNCIFWQDNNLEKLQRDLTNRIAATIGDGPAC